MNQLEQIKQDLIQNWQHYLHTEESGYDEDRESFEEYLSQIITKAYKAGQEAERKVMLEMFEEFNEEIEFEEMAQMVRRFIQYLINNKE